MVPEDQAEKADELLHGAASSTAEPKSSRKGGARDQKAKDKNPAKIIVDMREFRSELPALIHKRGIEIEPVTLQVSGR